MLLLLFSQLRVYIRHFQKGPVLKVIHLKSQTSVALPIYTSNIDSLTVLEEAAEQAKALKMKARTSSNCILCHELHLLKRRVK